MKKNLDVLIGAELTEEQKRFLKKGLACRCRLDGRCLAIRNATFAEAALFKDRLRSIGDYEVSYDYDVLEMDDLSAYEYFYCSGQFGGAPDTLIRLCESQFELNANPSFDYSGFCPICKHGAVQKAPLRVKGLTTRHFSKLLVTPFWTYWVINVEFKNELIASGITGTDFVPLYNFKNEVIQTNVQLKPTRILRNAIVQDEFQKARYSDKECTCTNFRYPFKGKTVKLRYGIKDTLLDFNELEEHNLSSVNGMYIISKKMLDVMARLGIKPNVDVEFTPVEFVEQNAPA